MGRIDDEQRKAQDAERNKTFLAISFLLLILNISLIVPVSIMVRQQKPVNLTRIPAIAMAAYTTYKVIMASVNLRKRRVSSDSLVWLLRTISFNRCARIDSDPSEHPYHGQYKWGRSEHAAAHGDHKRSRLDCSLAIVGIFDC